MKNKQHIRTEIEISASAEDAWAVLSDFAQYADWNPFIYKAAGTLEVGGRLDLTIDAGDGKSMRFRPKLTDVTPPLSFCWVGRVLVPGLFDGEHRFTLETIDENRVRLIHEEQFQGLLVNPILKRIRENTQQGFQAMNAALKTRLEG